MEKIKIKFATYQDIKDRNLFRCFPNYVGSRSTTVDEMADLLIKSGLGTTGFPIFARRVRG